MHDFIPLSEVQKILTFHPMKTYRLFTRYKNEGKLKEHTGWLLRDNQILINMSHFFVALEENGYKNFLTEDAIKSNQKFTDNEQMNTNDNSSFQMKSEEPEKEPETEEDVFTSENESDQVFTNDDIRQQPKTDANDMFTTIVSSKDEVIGVLRESLDRAERENVHLRKTNEEMAAYNRELSKMNFMLVAPDKARYGESVYREEPEEPIDVEAEVITPDPPKERRDEHENRQEPENEHHEERQQGDGGENENHQTHW